LLDSFPNAHVMLSILGLDGTGLEVAELSLLIDIVDVGGMGLNLADVAAFLHG
jgi:hypothetical protein